MPSHSQSPQRNRKSHPSIPGQPDDSPPHSLRGTRLGSMSQPDILHSHQAISQPPSYSPQKRSPPTALSTTLPQHVSSPNSQTFINAQYHPLPDQNIDHAQAQVPSQSRHSPPLNFPRPVQRVPPPSLLSSDPRLNNIREWSMKDTLLAEIDRAAYDHEAGNIAGLGAGPGSGSQPSVPMPKGPMIERERERVRDRTESPRDGDVGGSGGSAGSGPGRSGSLGRTSRPAQHPPQNDTPPHTPPHTQAASNQPQRPLPLVPDRPTAVRRDSSSRPIERVSPTYYSPLASPPSEPQHHAQAHPRDDSPSFQYDEHLQGATIKARTPDRSLPVQEENEVEEDVTITPALERERERERERGRERDRQLERELELEHRQLELERERDKTKERSRQIDHRLPTPRFSSSPMIPPEHIRVGEAPSDLELSTTVQGDDYADVHAVYHDGHDGRSSRAEHRFDEDIHNGNDDRHAEQRPAGHEAEDQDDTESYTPRSHHANLPSQTPTSNGGGGQHTERVMYNAAAHAQLNFRPRTASSDGAAMANLDTAMLRDAIEKLQDPHMPEYGSSLPADRGPPGQQQPYLGQSSSYSVPHSHIQHTAYPARVPTADDIRSIIGDPRGYEAWQSGSMHQVERSIHHVRPGAPVPPTPPNATTVPPVSHTVSHSAQSFSPPPARSTPYPFSYQYSHLVHRSQDEQQLLHHLQQQQLQQLLAASGMQTDSTFSPSATPFPSYDYSPFLADHFRRRNGVDEPSMSLRSSPSHMPVGLPMNLPIFPTNRRNPIKRKSVRRMRGSRELGRKLPPRGESTEPRETSPESSDGEEVVEGEEEEFENLAAQLETSGSSESATAQQAPSENEGEWVDENEEDVEDDLLHLEYHPNFVVNPDKRRKRWELKWDALLKAFQALDRQTDSTLLLLAAPTHGKSLHAVRSRSLRRLPSLANSPEISQIKSAFVTLSSRRKVARTQTRHMSLAERFEHYNSSTSSEGSESREEELKGALGAALSSLSALSSIYEGREQRWRTEMGRMGDERERVEVLLRQALGIGLGPGVL